jgi:1-acyl-sn-glycerol-3-phosphate acyltransferase
VVEHAFDETFAERWRRRIVTGPALLAATPAYLAALPVTLSAAAISDVVAQRPWTATRFAAALGVNLSMHAVGFGGVFASWLLGGRWAGADGERELELEQRVQTWWARTIWQATAAIYELDLHVEGDDCVSPGPILLLPRHASLVDTLLPLIVVADRHDLRLRYVMKRELLWDPVIDALGHRWPTAFVRRGTSDPRETAHVVHLADDLGANDAMVVFPEGTRFSEEKRQRVLESLRKKDMSRYERAKELHHVLPPRPSGVVSALEKHPDLDVVFFAHTGLEGANHFEDLLDGSLIGTRVAAKLWRVSHRDIPRDRTSMIDWLNDHWSEVDQWIEDQSV